MTEIQNLKISQSDTLFMLKYLDLTNYVKNYLEKRLKLKDIIISAHIANRLRNLCGDRLQEIGFDENYDPTPEGKILEDLIDKLFTG